MVKRIVPACLDTQTRRLSGRILSFIARGVDQPANDQAFNPLALEVFAYQFQRNAAYQAFCRGRGLTPATVGDWRQIPAVPAAAFKELPIVCFPVEHAVAVYYSSGTTGANRSAHYLPTLDLYEASLGPNFAAHLLPQGRPMPMMALAPPERQAPHSSLVHMLEAVVRDWGAPGSDFFVGEDGLQHQRLARALRRAEREAEPVCLLGAAFAFVHFLDRCCDDGLRFALPPGSRIMDTGGYKGRSREVPKAEIDALYEAVLGVPADHVVNEYGMTELGSQFYDNVLRDAHRGVRRPRFKVVPPWARTVVVDPETLEALPSGRPGLLRHYDLANLGSAMAVQTDDLGAAVEDGFQVLGRASGAEARGCSIAMDELLSVRPRAPEL